MNRRVLTLIILGFVLCSCTSNKIKYLPVEKRMEIANKYYDEKKYKKAIPLFEQIAFEKNSGITAEAQIKLADCYFKREEYIDAEYEYKEMIRLFPEYHGIEFAYFRLAETYYNQSLKSQYTQDETIKAIESFQEYYQKFSHLERKKIALDIIQKCQMKLIKKKYENGYIYYKLEDFSSALMYFKEVMDLGNVDELDKLSNYYSIKIYAYRKDLIMAEKYLNRLISKYSDNKLIKKAEKYIKKKIKSWKK